jgi:hypothetical protein
MASIGIVLFHFLFLSVAISSCNLSCLYLRCRFTDALPLARFRYPLPCFLLVRVCSVRIRIDRAMECANDNTIASARHTGGARPPLGIARVTLTTAHDHGTTVVLRRFLYRESQFAVKVAAREGVVGHATHHWHAVRLLRNVVVIILVARFVRYAERLDAIPTEVPE